MTKKKKKISNSNAANAMELSSAIPYKKSAFGMKSEEVKVYLLEVTVNQLLNDFKIFEELNNVQSWPISTLIQRELDHQRAERIAKDYLLNSGNTKYFPPLISVLIPTDSDYLPKSEYDEVLTNNPKLTEIQARFVSANPEKYNDYEQPEEIISGLFSIPFDIESGDIVWDKHSLTSVVIDGQHRYKALKAAAAINRDIYLSKITITLIDIADICQRTSKSPTDVARDLFVTINNTPVEVDETRLVLMDDKDILSCLTQATVDDGSSEYHAAIPPELNDWDCEGAKHNTDISLSGVLTLRQIILTAMFGNIRSSSIDDRQKPRQIRKWLDKLSLWLNPDKEIEEELGKRECFSHRYTVATKTCDSSYDVEDDDSLFLFSWSPSASKIVKKKFSEIYLPVFKKVFNELTPYKHFHNIAAKNGAFKANSKLNNYLRSFRGKRKELGNDSEVKLELNKYKSDIKKLTENNILFTVMGQKAIFKVLFDNYLAFVENKTPESLLAKADKFINDFNILYSNLYNEESPTKSFFSLGYKMKRKTHNVGNLSDDFWGGILLKINKELDYGTKAVGILSTILADALECTEKGSKFSFTSYSDIKKRHISQLKKVSDDYDDVCSEEIAEKIIEKKATQLADLIKSV